jgi:hypothetical protein
MHIYGDEGGYTGNQLLDDQDVFTYATVAIEQGEAEQIVARLKRDYRLQGNELKGRNLIKRPSNRKVVDAVLQSVQGRFSVTAHHKAFALCCKFFEYVFEPTVSNSNSFFYGIDFHLYIGTILYRYLDSHHRDAEELLQAFSLYARKGQTQGFHDVLPAMAAVKLGNRPLQLIGSFASLHRETISEEIGHADEGQPGWLLDLVRTAVYHQLTHWSEKLGEIDVVLDDSAPLRLVKPLFDGFVGKREVAYIEFRGVRHPYTFNLKRPVTLMDSKLSAGIQLADVVASTAAYGYSQAIRGDIGDQERKWLALLLTGTDQTVWPDASRFSSRSSEGFAGKFVLTELVRRSIEKQDLYDGLPEALRTAMWKRAMSRLKKRLERRAASR